MTEEQDRTAQEADKQAPTQPAEGENQGPTKTDGDAEDQEDGRKQPPDDLSQDPAYEPRDEGLKDIKGG